MVKKSIMLQGYLCDANFGDILAADLFYKRCLEAGFKKVDFFQFKHFGIGNFCRKQIGYTTQKKLISCFWANCFVIISGGSFWNNKNINKDAKRRFIRFIFPALIYQFLGKPVYILGVGGGPVDTIWLRRTMIRVLNKAKVVTFRDEETKKIFQGYGVKNTMTVTADTMLSITKDMLAPFEEKNLLDQTAKNKKKLLLHLPDGSTENENLLNLILPALIIFLKQHEDYFLIVSNDNLRNIDEKEKKVIDSIFKTLSDSKVGYYFYKYHDSWQMCSLINEMDSLITLKLHVGVVGCALDKAVISFPVHREKTDNFYKMIGESKRCVNVIKLNEQIAFDQINSFYNVPVHISDEMRKTAEKNLSVLNNIILKKKILLNSLGTE